MTRMAAWIPSLGLKGLFLAALHHSQNQQNRFENGEGLHVSAWYCFSPMGPTLCARLDDPSGSLNPHFRPHGTTFCRARPPIRPMLSGYHRSPAGLSQPLGCCHRSEAWWSSLGAPSGAWCIKKCAPGGGPGRSKIIGDTNLHCESAGCETRTNDSIMTA